MVFPNMILTVDSGESTADIAVVLGGGELARAERAAELYHDNKVPRILLSGAGDCESNELILLRAGVPEAAILREDRSRSTMQNAQFTAPILKQLGVHRVIIVTSWYHSRRALACFRGVLPDATFLSRPSYEGFSESWEDYNTQGYVVSEYVKTIGYWLFYGVSPFLASVG